MNRSEKISRLWKILYFYKRRHHILPYFPIRLWVESSNICNLKCLVCPNATDTTSTRGTMDISLFEAIVDQIEGKSNDLNLSHRGEPLFHPELERMIALCRNRKLGTRIHTNATILDQSRSIRLLESGPDLVSFSFDGYDRDSYAAARIGGDFDKTLGNIKTFLQEKKQRRFLKPYTVIQIIEPWDATQEYRDRLNAFAAVMRHEGLDKFYIKRPHNWAGNAPGESQTTRKFTPCTFLFYSLTVLWDGTVCPCPQDWYGSMSLGNLKQQSIEEIWNGDLLTDLRKKMFRKDLSGLLCEHCDRIFRPVLLGIPTENIKAFLGETLAGYDWVAKFIRR